MHRFGPTPDYDFSRASERYFLQRREVSEHMGAMGAVLPEFENQEPLINQFFTCEHKLINDKQTSKMFRVVDPSCNFVFSKRLTEEECSNSNVEWLYNEYLKERLMHVTEGDDLSLIPCLKTVNRDINLDSLLTKPNVLLSAFPAITDLEPYYMEPIKTIDFSSFKILGLIGKGAFSNVFVVRRKDTGEVFAMKAMKKSQFILQDKEEYIFNEREILSTMDHPYIVRYG